MENPHPNEYDVERRCRHRGYPGKAYKCVARLESLAFDPEAHVEPSNYHHGRERDKQPFGGLCRSPHQH